MKTPRVSSHVTITILLFFLTSTIAAQPTTIEVSGNISENTTWSDDTVKVTGHVTVNEGVTLSVDPGTQVVSTGRYGIFIHGYLKAKGNQQDSIIFTTSNLTDFFESTDTSAGWLGITFLEGGFHTDTSIFSFCEISYVKSNEYNRTEWKLEDYVYDGAVYVSSDHRLSFSHCMIHNNLLSYFGGGITTAESLGGYLSIQHSTIKDNKARNGGGIYSNGHKNLLIRNNLFDGNSSARGGAIYCHNSKVLICDNIIKGNILYPSKIIKSEPVLGGAGIYSIYNNIRIVNNMIVLNESWKVGGGIVSILDNAEIINNTISHNIAVEGGGIYFEESNARVKNAIIWGNTNDQYWFLDNDELNFYNCLVQEGIDTTGLFFKGTIEGIIDTDPAFVNPVDRLSLSTDTFLTDWSVQNHSPAINAGLSDPKLIDLPPNDIAGSKRILHGIADLGALEKHIDRLILSGYITSDTLIIADSVFINGDLTTHDTTTFRIAPGTRLFFKNPNVHNINGKFFAEGTASDPILFSTTDTTNFFTEPADSGTWRGIKMYGDSARLIHCTFRYVGGSIYCGSDDSYFQNCIFEDCKTTNILMYLTTGGTATIENCTYRNNRIDFHDPGFGMLTAFNNTRISNCAFTGNEADSSCIINAGFDNVIIEKCNISNNMGTGIMCYDNSNPNKNIFKSAESIRIFNTTIANNTGEGFKILGVVDSTILVNNLIVNNGSGIEIDNYTAGVILNNTIMNNSSWGLSAMNTAASLTNNILAGNDSGQLNLINTSLEVQNSIIEGGINSLFFHYGYIKQMVNLIDTIPYITNPSSGPGPHASNDNTNWTINGLSPGYNAGLSNPDQMYLPHTDIVGNPRIHDGEIDIGAFELQGVTLDITRHPRGGTYCSGEIIILSITSSDTALYQWSKDGLLIPGVTDKSFIIDSASFISQGAYACEAYTNYGQVTSNSAYIFVIEDPKIISAPRSEWIKEGKNHKMNLFVTGTNPTYKWLMDNVEMPDQYSPDLEFQDFSLENEGVYHGIATNECGSDTTSAISLFYAPQICMVTVSPTTGHNLVIWEKKSKAPILTYNVYRESEAAGIYDLLVSQSYDELSVFVDTTADPTVQAYLYKITAIDSGGLETDIDLCSPHKTIHLIVSTNPELNTTQLQWDRYYGFDYQTYTIYKSSTGVNFDPVHSMSASLNSWTDPDPSTGDHFYRIAVEKPVPCVPEGSGKKAGTGPYQHTLSNMDDNKLKAGQIPPDTITISFNSIAEENLPGALIGKFLTVDRDTADSHSYKFVSGDGDDDNFSFSILSDMLLASETFDFETKSEYKIRIRSTDEAGNYCEVPFIIQIIDVDETTGLSMVSSGVVSAYPNPLIHATTITFPNQTNEHYRLILTNLSGKVCRIVDDIKTSEYILKKEDLKPGLYFIELRGPKIYRGKIVIE